MGAFSDVFDAEKKEGATGLKGFKGFKAPDEQPPGTLSTLLTLLAPVGGSQIPRPNTTPADEPRCPTCRHWWPIPGDVWHPTGEAVGDCLHHGFETLERDNCKAHERQQGSALRRNGA